MEKAIKSEPKKPVDSVLSQAESLIYGDRAQTYGSALGHLSAVSEFWSTYLRNKHGANINLTGEDVCWMMTLLKMVRQLHQYKEDNLVDAAGYIGLIEKADKGL